MVYTYRIRTSNNDLIKIFNDLQRHRVAYLKDSNLSRKCGRLLNDIHIRNDIIIASDYRLKKNIIALSPQIDVLVTNSYKKKKNSFDFIFKRVF